MLGATSSSRGTRSATLRGSATRERVSTRVSDDPEVLKEALRVLTPREKLQKALEMVRVRAIEEDPDFVPRGELDSALDRAENAEALLARGERTITQLERNLAEQVGASEALRSELLAVNRKLAETKTRASERELELAEQLRGTSVELSEARIAAAEGATGVRRLRDMVRHLFEVCEAHRKRLERPADGANLEDELDLSGSQSSGEEVGVREPSQRDETLIEGILAFVESAVVHAGAQTELANERARTSRLQESLDEVAARADLETRENHSKSERIRALELHIKKLSSAAERLRLEDALEASRHDLAQERTGRQEERYEAHQQRLELETEIARLHELEHQVLYAEKQRSDTLVALSASHQETATLRTGLAERVEQVSKLTRKLERKEEARAREQKELRKSLRGEHRRREKDSKMDLRAREAELALSRLELGQSHQHQLQMHQALRTDRTSLHTTLTRLQELFPSAGHGYSPGETPAHIRDDASEGEI
jgi:septal ring factor EnvC (AmiA/AmiB activator)